MADHSTGMVSTDNPERDDEVAPVSVQQAKAATQHHGLISRLSTGTGAFDILGKRRWYYIFSSCLILLSILFILVRGFNFSLDFVGGTQLTFQKVPAATTVQVADVLHKAIGVETDSVIDVGSNVQVSLPSLDATQVTAAKQALTTAFHLTTDVSDSAVSGTWGSEISTRALISVIVFLIAVAIFVWVRYERGIAIGAVLSVLHDLIVAAGIYALIGFEVAPATVIGLLTILGFSLYDTVVVYDKVEENTKGLTSLLRRTYPEAANLAINQTLMRSINTSLIALLPVAGLLTAGVAILGSGTLKDLSLVMLCGMLIGAYSSVFLAVPMAVDFKMREPAIANHTRRVLAKRKADGLIVDADGDPIGRVAPTDADGEPAAHARPLGNLPGMQAEPVSPKLKPGSGPLPGVKPARPGGKSAGAASGNAASAHAASGKAASGAASAARPTGKRSR
ncbi:MAG: protein-export membrane protein SecF [Actinobacteria bacterium 69-20]|nr:MAG: protein-export membrane protein SecF [Actinobacteria bacterium 69-20]